VFGFTQWLNLSATLFTRKMNLPAATQGGGGGLKTGKKSNYGKFRKSPSKKYFKKDNMFTGGYCTFKNFFLWNYIIDLD
jgi:hypothetical protein